MSISRLCGMALGYLALDLKGFKKSIIFLFLISVLLFYASSIKNSEFSDFDFSPKQLVPVEGTSALVIGGSSIFFYLI